MSYSTNIPSKPY